MTHVCVCVSVCQNQACQLQESNRARKHVCVCVPTGHEREMQENIPPNEYYEYFAPDFSLHIPSDKLLENCNRRDVLERVSV